MSNRAYFCCTDWKRIYPSSAGRQAGFDPKIHTVLSSAGCVPLLWLGMFSFDDLVESTFELDDGPYDVVAPLARREAAIERLRSRREWLDALFRECGGVATHVDLFLEHVSRYGKQWLTIELDEISHLYDDPDEWYEMLGDALVRMDARDEDAKDTLVELSTVMTERRIPLFADLVTSKQEERWNFFRVMGEGWLSPAPWG